MYCYDGKRNLYVINNNKKGLKSIKITICKEENFYMIHTIDFFLFTLSRPVLELYN